MITWDNYEEYILLHADGELDEAGERELMGFVAKHPELRAELDAYASVKLMPDTNLVFADKQSLMRQEEVVAPVQKTRIISLGGWRQYSAAAGIVLVVLLAATWLVNRNQRSEVNSQVAVTNNQPVVVDSPKGITTQAPKEEIAQIAQPAPANKVVETTTTAQPGAPKRQAIAQHQPIAPKYRDIIQQPASNNQQPTPNTPQPITNTQQLASNNTPQQPKQDIQQPTTNNQQLASNIEEPASSIEEPASKTSFIEKLPLSQEKRDGLENLKENFNQTLAKAKNIRKEVKDVTIALKFGNKELRVF